MRNLFRKKIVNKPLLRDSIVILSASMAVNILNYLFQLYMGRSLGPADYSIFASVVSLLYIVSVPSSTINTSVVKFVSGFMGRKEFGKVKALLCRGLKYTVFFAALGFAAISIFSSHIASFLNIPYTSPIIILGLIFSISIITPLGSGTLQGLQRFTRLGASNVAGTFAKFIIGIALVSLGFGVDGALISLFFGSIISIVLFAWFLRDIFKKKLESFDRNSIISYSMPVFLSLFLISVLGNIDIILVKHYFTGVEAGYYAAAALIGKIVLFSSGAMCGVMFAKVAEMKALGKPTKGILHESMFYIFCICSVAVTCYYIAPTFVLTLLFGAAYLPAVPLVGIFGLAMAFFALSAVLVYYNLALKNTSFIPVLFIVLIIEVSMIIFFHGTLLSVVKILAGTMVVVFSSMLMLTKGEFIPQHNS